MEEEMEKESASTKKRRHRFYDGSGPASYVALGAFDRDIRKVSLPGKTDVLKYKPLPRTDSEIVSSCTFSLRDFDETGEVCRCDQFDKIVLDSLYTVYHRDKYKSLIFERDPEDEHEEEKALLFQYNISNIVKDITRKNAPDSTKKAVSESLLKLSGIDVVIDCKDEMDSRKGTGESLQNLAPFGEKKPLIDCDFVFDKDGIVNQIFVKSEPELYRYGSAVKHFQLVGESAFRFPEGMKVTKQRLMLLTYLRDRILVLNRKSALSRIILFKTLLPIVLQKEKCTRSEKQKIHKETVDILQKFADDGILTGDIPFEVKKDKNSIIGIELQPAEKAVKEAVPDALYDAFDDYEEIPF